MTIESITAECGLNWSGFQIAGNLNRYRTAKPTEYFWTLWKSNKNEIEEQNISVYEEDEFLVYDWGTGADQKATQEEYDTQEREKTESKIRRMRAFFEECAEDLGGRSRRRMLSQIDCCHTVDDFDYLAEQELRGGIDALYEAIKS